MAHETTNIGKRAGAPLYIAGWICVVIFATVALYTNGWSAWLFSGVIAIIAVGMIVWYRATEGRAAVVVGLVLGALIALAMGFGVAGDLQEDEPLKRTLNDIFVVGAGLLIVVGSLLGLAGHKRADR